MQEYDLTTGMLLGTWDAFNPGGKPNIPLSQSQQPVPEQSRMPWDAYHVNSISLVGGNEFLVSMRNTWAAYLVDAATGKIVWTLSANPKVVSSFKIARNAGFSWQHDVELQPGNIVSIFDDACCQLANGKIKLPTSPSRGLVLRLDASRHTASLVAAYPDPHARQPDSVFLGNTDLLPGGHAVIGWGSTPFLSEFSRSGKLLLDAVWPRPDLSYRAFKQIWVGLPLYPPSGASVTSHGKTTVYASWNGATEVAAWRVLGGASGAAQLQVVVKRAGKTGFETAIPVPVKSATFEVEALNSAGAVIGTSRSFSVPNSGSGTGLPQSY